MSETQKPLRTIQVVQVRAQDLPSRGGSIRLPGQRWRTLYEVVVGGEEAETDEGTTISENDLDERWTLLRVDADPTVILTPGRRGEESRKFAVCQGRADKLVPPGPEFNDQYMVVRSDEPIDLQLVVEVPTWDVG